MFLENNRAELGKQVGPSTSLPETVNFQLPGSTALVNTSVAVLMYRPIRVDIFGLYTCHYDYMPPFTGMDDLQAESRIVPESARKWTLACGIIEALEWPQYLAANHLHRKSYSKNVLDHLEDLRQFKECIRLCIEKGWNILLTWLLGEGVDPNQNNGYRTYPIHEAVQKGKVDILRTLLSAPSIDINVRDTRDPFPNVSALEVAVDLARPEMIELLHSRSEVLLERDDGHLTALHRACMRDPSGRLRPGLLGIILRAKPGIDINIIGDGKTPLMYATEHGNEEAVKELLAVSNIEVNVRGAKGRSALITSIASLYCESINFSDKFVSVIDPWIRTLEALLKYKGLDLDIQDAGGRTACSWAAWGGMKSLEHLGPEGILSKDVSPEYLQQLLKQGADHSKPDHEGYTPLDHAIAARFVTRYLVQAAERVFNNEERSISGRSGARHSMLVLRRYEEVFNRIIELLRHAGARKSKKKYQLPRFKLWPRTMWNQGLASELM